MEMVFSASIITAIDAVMRLAQGRLWLGSERAVLKEAPSWCNFRFPSRLKASPIERVERNDPIAGERIGSWELARTVEFFYLRKRVATVFLTGKLLDGCSGDNDSFWSVQRIKYLLYDAEEGEAEVYVGDNLSCAPR